MGDHGREENLVADRFFFDGYLDRDTVCVRGTQAHHIVHVLRMRAGQEILLLDGAGGVFRGRIREIRDGSVTASLLGPVEEDGEPAVSVFLWQGLCRGEKMDWIVQKATELGVRGIRVVPMARSGVKIPPERLDSRIRRWETIAADAARQCRRARFPPVGYCGGLPEALESPGTEEAEILVCWEGEASHPLSAALRRDPDPARPRILVIGPEGGLEEGEVQALRERGGRTVTLGRRILRTETAALAALSCLMYEYGEIP